MGQVLKVTLLETVERPLLSHRLLRNAVAVDPTWRTQDRKSTRLNSSHLGISYAVFCLNTTAASATYTLSLHDALPIFDVMILRRSSDQISWEIRSLSPEHSCHGTSFKGHPAGDRGATTSLSSPAPQRRRSRSNLAHTRSEEHTSELQSLRHLVCRLLLEYYRGIRDLHSFPTRRSSDLRCHDPQEVFGPDIMGD